VPIVIHTVHGPTFPDNINPIKRLFFRTLEKLCAKFTDFFIFVGEELRDEYLKNNICVQEKTAVIRTGLSREEILSIDSINSQDIDTIRKNITEKSEVFLIGYVARLVPSKAQNLSIDILARLRKRGIPAYLVFIGEAYLEEEKKYKEYLEKLSCDLKVRDYVLFLGYKEKVFPYLKAMDVLILTSKYEGLPNIAVEAGLARKPLVSFRVCGISEVIEDEKTGYIIENGNEEAAAERLEYLWQRRTLIEEMGNNAYDRVSYSYDADKMAREELSLYSSILSKLPGN
jgi:glycosyltransferase involved in cell wall biosynthesis